MPNLSSLCRLTLLGIVGSSALSAQQAVTVPDSPPSEPATRRVLSDKMPDGIGRIGPFDILPQVSLVTYYDDNINNTSTNELDDIVITITPGVLASAVDLTGTEVTKSFTISYSPSFQIYTDNSDLTGVNHAGSVDGKLFFNRLSLGFNESITQESSPNPDVGARTDTLTAVTGLTSNYELGAKTSVDVNLRYTITDNTGLSSSRELANDDWINYIIGNKTTVGLGVVLGWVDVEDGVDQTFEQIRARASYEISEKLVASASAGGEFRQYDSDADDTMNPVWDASLTYAARGTTLSLSTYQRYSSSALSGGQNYLTTGVDLTFFQSLGDRFRFNLTTTYSHADYESTEGAAGFVDRKDDIFGVRTGLDVIIRANWTAGVFYSHDANESSQELFTYRKNQVGIQTSWQF